MSATSSGNRPPSEAAIERCFETFGSRAIYQEGWIASGPPIVPPWALSLTPSPLRTS